MDKKTQEQEGFQGGALGETHQLHMAVGKIKGLVFPNDSTVNETNPNLLARLSEIKDTFKQAKNQVRSLDDEDMLETSLS